MPIDWLLFQRLRVLGFLGPEPTLDLVLTWDFPLTDATDLILLEVWYPVLDLLGVKACDLDLGSLGIGTY